MTIIGSPWYQGGLPVLRREISGRGSTALFRGVSRWDAHPPKGFRCRRPPKFPTPGKTRETTHIVALDSIVPQHFWAFHVDQLPEFFISHYSQSMYSSSFPLRRRRS